MRSLVPWAGMAWLKPEVGYVAADLGQGSTVDVWVFWGVCPLKRT